MIITIDGPAGSGKSTAARMLAARLQVANLDTGAMYRAVAYQTLREKAPPNDQAALIDVARRAEINMNCTASKTTVHVGGQDVTDAIRSMEVSKTTSVIASIQPIRDILVAKQRAIGADLGSFVTEGRDQGSVVFPDADVKFVLEASPQRRAKRRYDNLHAVDRSVSYDEVLAHVQHRDGVDAIQWKALLAPGAAIRIDTTDMNIDEVVDTLESHVLQRAARTAD